MLPSSGELAPPISSSRGATIAPAAQLWLIEPAASPFASRITQAASELKLSVHHLEPDAAPPTTGVIGIGPSISEPLQVARELRQQGCMAPCIFFTASAAQHDTLKAQLVRDPFICDRFELIEVTGDRRQLASSMRQAGDRVRRAGHRKPPTRRSAPRTRRAGPKATDQYLATVLSQAGEAIVSADSNRQITTWNDAAEKLFGHTAEAVLGQPLSLLETEDGQLRKLADEALQSGTTRQANVICRTAAGDAVAVALSVAPIQDERKQQIGVALVARDNTAFEEAEEALRDANRQKDEFLAIMSHELRTPLTSILGYTDMVLRGLGGPLSERSQRYVANVRSAGDRLLDLVNGLLDFTRLEAGTEKLDLAPIDLRAMVQHVVERCRSAAESKQLELQVSVTTPSGQVDADEDKLQHVVSNYLGNAIKFTPEGGNVHVQVGPDPRHQDRVRVTVADSGIGIRNEQLARVWERFYQGDASLTRPYGGMGLGLSIARHLVHLHGGEVGVESSGPGRGSSFWFSLPLRSARERPHTARTAPQRAETRG